MRRFELAKESYGSGLKSFEAGDFDAARGLFHEAWVAFEKLDEKAFAHQARKARAWATLNASGGGEASHRLPLYGELVQEALLVEDTELVARARAGRALAASELNYGEVDESLREALRDTETLGLDKLSGKLYAAVARRSGELGPRAGAARRAMALLDGQVEGVYAMYDVAVDAYNEGDYELAIALCEETSGRRGELAADIQQVLDASRSQL